MRVRNLSCPYCKKRTTRDKMVNHIDYNHSDQLPEGFTALRMTFHVANNKPIEYRRPCRVCGNPTEWDENKGRYNLLCSNPVCKEKYVAKMKASMGDKYGAYRPTATAEGLEKMLAARKISGKYKWSDGTIFNYTGSYELETLKFMDGGLNIKSEDLMVPGPVLEYEYNGEKHLYITDMYYRPYNLIIEVKDGGRSVNKNKEYAETRAKQMAKEKHVIQNTDYNYIRLTDKDMGQLMAVLADLKYHFVEKDPDRVIHVNENTPIAAIAPMVGFNPDKDVVIVNYMKKKTFVDDSDYAIADSPKFDTVYTRDQDGILRKKDKSVLLGSYYTPYIIRGRREAIVNTLYENKDKEVSKNFIYETAFGHPMYSKNQLQYEACEEYTDYYQDLENIRESFNFNEKESVVEETAHNSEISKPYFIKSKDGVDNACINHREYSKPMRARSSMLILKEVGGKLYVYLRKNKGTDLKANGKYSAPGGGWNKSETPMDAAIREAQEEARINVDRVRFCGTLIEYHDTVAKWVKDNVENPNDWWYGYYSKIYVGFYAGKYNGKIEERDKESSFIKDGNFYLYDDVVYDIPGPYAEAIDLYIQGKSLTEAATEKDIERNQKLEPIFVVNTFTGTWDGKLIRAAAGMKYSHALISLNSKLSPMYSFDETEVPDPKNPKNKTMYKGLVIDNFERYKREMGFGDLRVIVIMVTKSTKKKIEEGIKYYVNRIDQTKYSYKKLIGHIIGSKEFSSFGDMAMVCSEFVDTILKYANIDISGKASANTRPDDLSTFHDKNNFFQVYEGKISQYNPRKIDAMIENLRQNTEYKNLKSQTKNSMKSPFDHELGRENLIPGMVKRGGKTIAKKIKILGIKKVLKEDGTFEYIDEIIEEGGETENE